MISISEMRMFQAYNSKCLKMRSFQDMFGLDLLFFWTVLYIKIEMEKV